MAWPAFDVRPLFVVTGAFGTGKTTVAPALAAALGECVVMDVDWLLESLALVAGSPIPQTPRTWAGVGDTWLSFAGVVGVAGRSLVICCPATPGELEASPSRHLVGEIHYAMLDCADDVIRERLGSRGRWTDEDTAESFEDAAKLRRLGLYTIRTDECTPDDAAARLAVWVRSLA